MYIHSRVVFRVCAKHDLLKEAQNCKGKPLTLESFKRLLSLGDSSLCCFAPKLRFSTASPRSRAKKTSESKSKREVVAGKFTMESRDFIDFERTRLELLLVRRRFDGDGMRGEIVSSPRCWGRHEGNGSEPKASSKSQHIEGKASSLVGNSAKTAAMSNCFVTLVHSRVAGSSTRRLFGQRFRASFLEARFSASVAGPEETVTNRLLLRI